MAGFDGRVHNGAMTQDHGWVSYDGGGDNAHLTDDRRQMVQERIRLRHESRGELLGVVEVRVYENGCEPQVTVPHGAVLGVESDQSEIAELVARALTELDDWR